MSGKALVLSAILSAALAGSFAATALAGEPRGCREPKTGTNRVPVFSPPLAERVIGAGRLQFYSAPDFRCPLRGVFVIPRDELVVYAQTDDGWMSVMYLNPGTGIDVSGWVRSERLKAMGSVGPRQ